MTLALTVGGIRGGEGGRTPVLVIPQGTTEVQLQLILKDDDYPHYSATLRKAEGAEILRWTSLKPVGAQSGANLIFTVPANKLGSGDYVLTLKGISQSGAVDDIGRTLFLFEKR